MYGDSYLNEGRLPTRSGLLIGVWATRIPLGRNDGMDSHHVPMSTLNIKLLKGGGGICGITYGTTIGVIKGDTRSLALIAIK